MVVAGGQEHHQGDEQAATELRSDLIVTGSRGLGTLERLVLGSVATGAEVVAAERARGDLASRDLDDLVTWLDAWGSSGNGDGQFEDPTGIAIYGDRVYVLSAVPVGIAGDAQHGPQHGGLGAAVRDDSSRDLALQLLSDAEGADHDIAIDVVNAASEADALEVGRAVSRSALFKAAIFGRDPNWGRILASVGTTAAAFDPADLDVAINGVWVCRNSGPGDSREKVDLEPRAVTVTIDLKAGSSVGTIWTNDLTHAYVHENSAYSS